MAEQQAHKHHYVPQWYQKRFLPTGKNTLLYLNLKPDTVVIDQGKAYSKKALLHWPTQKCFFADDLYMLRFGQLTTDRMEKLFFGEVDRRGKKAVEAFGDYRGFAPNIGEAYQDLVPYMGSQRFRTPRGLDWIRTKAGVKEHNQLLLTMRAVFQQHTTMWSEGVWEIVGAHNSSTKFIITDEPITFYNRRVFPGETRYPGTEEFDGVGTRTIFPLGLETCLVITHTQFVRNPRLNPLNLRENARAFETAYKNMLDTQFGRELEEDEIRRINLILKRKATRYIASLEEEWLYPERQVSTTEWAKLDDDWFLLPHLYKVSFSGGMVVGFQDGSSWAVDEYGRKPSHPKYKDKKAFNKEWKTHLWAKKTWAIKRRGRSVAHVYDGPHDVVADRLMQEFLEKQGT